MNIPHIDTTSIDAKFKEHLDLANNSHIIFSAPFGTGKTTYLFEFFGRYANDYVPIFLRPVQYSISSNEDVVKLIQRDIIKSLLIALPEDEEPQFSSSECLQYFLTHNKSVKDFIDVTMECIGGPIEKTYKFVNALVKLQKSFEQNMQEANKSQYAQLQELCDKINCETDVAYEQLIADIISAFDMPRVLVIDDIDRLDPEHIFRLFNVFSATLQDDEVVRLGFDKIVFVCDIENIRRIFSHRYGAETDFSGYIDKFYSVAPFFFDITEAVASYYHFYVGDFMEDYNHTRTCVARDLVKCFTEYGLLSLRKLKNLTQTTFKCNSVELNDIYYKENNNDGSVSLMAVLEHLFKYIPGLEADIRNCHFAVKATVGTYGYRLLCFALYYAQPYIQKESVDKDDNNRTYDFPSLDIKLIYKREDYANPVLVIMHSNGVAREDCPLFDILIIALNNFRNIYNTIEI